MSRVGDLVESVLWRVADRAFDTAALRQMRDEAAEGLQGQVLEIGWGSGLNVPHYPDAVDRVLAVEPSAVAKRVGRARAASSRAPVEFAGDDAQELSLEDASVDSALSTVTLCTIPDPLRALREIHRVLRPGGAFHFGEHGLAPDPKISRWQHRLTPMQRRVFAGCHLNRPIAELVEAAGFEIELTNRWLPGPPVLKPWNYLYIGRGHKPR